MAQIFPKWTNKIPLIAGLVAGPASVLVVAFITYYFSPKFLEAGYQPTQPVPYSHKLHVGELGLDCRYCHFSVEQSAVAVIPPTKTCMNCHALVKNDSALLAPLIHSSLTQEPMEWVRVHNLPEYAYFNHSAHVNSGIGCASCHGPIDQMDVVYQQEPLSMGWCLDCHRGKWEEHLRPLEEVFNMQWTFPRNQSEFVEQVKQQRRIEPPTDCSGCHR